MAGKKRERLFHFSLRGLDKNLLVVLFFMLIFGFIMIYSASYYTAGLSKAYNYDPMYLLKTQIAYSILKEGIYLAGGSTRLKNIDKFLADLTGYGVCLSEMHDACTIRGVEKIIKDKYLQEWAVPVRQKKM